MMNKGRGNWAKGETVHTAKLNKNDILEIRQFHTEGMGSTTLGRMFDVSKTTIMNIINKNTWRHV